MKLRKSVRREASSLSGILEEIHMIESLEVTVERVLLSREGPYQYLALIEFSTNELVPAPPGRPYLPGFD